MRKIYVRKILCGPFLFIAMCLLVGCQNDPYADWFVKKQVFDEAITGTYVVTNDTVEHFATAKIPPHGKILPVSRDAKIVLTGDHKIYLSSIPYWDVFNGQVCVLSGTGVWKFAKNDDFTIVQVSLGKIHAGRKMQDVEMASLIFSSTCLTIPCCTGVRTVNILSCI